jgi:methionyl-tRNA formyltransferase
MTPYPKIAFFGTPYIAVCVLEELKKKNIIPSCIITNPDTRQGRNMVYTQSAVSLWAHTHSIPVFKPDNLKTEETFLYLKALQCDLYIVTAYGKIIPQTILDIPSYGVLNMHPSLLPLLRGPSPIRSALLEDMNQTGVSIMKLTAGMDEGPILAQETITIPKENWPMHGNELDTLLAHRGGALLANILPHWIRGDCVPQEQDHAHATYSHKITKKMAEISLADDAYINLIKIRAFDGFPYAFFFHEKNGVRTRIKIIDAKIVNNTLVLTRIIPEGRKEMSWEDFLRGI